MFEKIVNENNTDLCMNKLRLNRLNQLTDIMLENQWALL